MSFFRSESLAIPKAQQEEEKKHFDKKYGKKRKKCPKCGTTASGYSDLLKFFGLRNMTAAAKEAGHRNAQSWCFACRSNS